MPSKHRRERRNGARRASSATVSLARCHTDAVLEPVDRRALPRELAR